MKAEIPRSPSRHDVGVRTRGAIGGIFNIGLAKLGTTTSLIQ